MTGLVPIDTNEQTTLEISQETVVIETDEKELETSQYALDPKPRKRSIDETCEPNELNEPDVIKRQKSVLKRDLDDTNEKVVSGDIEKPTILKEDQDEKLDIDEVQSDKKEDHDETMVINKDSSELKEVVSPVKAGSKNPVPDVLGEKKEVTPIETKEHTPNQTSVATDKSTEKEDKEIAKESSAQEQTAEITARTKGISMEEKVSTPKEKVWTLIIYTTWIKILFLLIILLNRNMFLVLVHLLEDVHLVLLERKMFLVQHRLLHHRSFPH